MSVDVTSEQLAETLEDYGFAYLITISDEARPHVVAVSAPLTSGALTVIDLGRRIARNAEARPSVTFRCRRPWLPSHLAGLPHPTFQLSIETV